MSSCWIRGSEEERERKRDSNFRNLFQFSFPFSAISLMIPSSTWLLFWKLPLWGTTLLLACLYKRASLGFRRPPPRFLRQPVALTQPPPTGTMKVSAVTFAVLLATAAFCAPASASPCKSGPDHCSPGPDPHTGPDFALL